MDERLEGNCYFCNKLIVFSKFAIIDKHSYCMDCEKKIRDILRSVDVDIMTFDENFNLIP